MAMQIAELVAGPELDALVAEKVMRLRFTPGTVKMAWLYPPYSTDIAAAWQVAEKFEDGGVAVVRAFAVVRDSRPSIDGTGGRWQAQIWTDRNEYAQYVAYADTAPLAICRAALAAVEDHAMRSSRELNQS